MRNLVRREDILPIGAGQWLSRTIDITDGEPSRYVVLCHGLSGDKVGPQRLLSTIAEQLAWRCGVCVVRFDFRGAGLSSGAFIDTTISRMVEDALHVGGQHSAPLIWMGVSTGALVALMAAARRNLREDVIAISNGLGRRPYDHDEGHATVALRQGELLLDQGFFIERAALAPQTELINHVGDVTVLLGTNDTQHYGEEGRLRAAGATVKVIEGGDHLFSGVELRRCLIDKLVETIHAKG